MAAEPMRSSAPDTQILVSATIIGGFVIGWGASTLWSIAEAAWHKSRCPIDAFSSGGLGGPLSSFAVGILICFLVIWIVVLLVSRSSVGRSLFETWSPPSRNPSLSAFVRIMGWAVANYPMALRQPKSAIGRSE